MPGESRASYLFVLVRHTLARYSTSTDGNAASYLMKWSGTAWAAVGTGVNGAVRALKLSPDHLNVYVGGAFTTAGGTTRNRIAKWTISSSTWSSMGTGFDATVYAIATNAGGGMVYAGGAL